MFMRVYCLRVTRLRLIFPYEPKGRHVGYGPKCMELQTNCARTRALCALCLLDYHCFSWSQVLSADLHVVELTFKRGFDSFRYFAQSGTCRARVSRPRCRLTA